MKIFSAGHSVKKFPWNGRDPLTYNDPLRQVVRDLELCCQPVIIMVVGSVWGDFRERIMDCDIIVAAKGLAFAAPTAKIGVPYNSHDDQEGTHTFIKKHPPAFKGV